MLSPIIEYLFAQNKLGGVRLCHPSRLQFILDLPAGTIVTFDLAPPASYWGAIKYSGTIGDEVVPNTVRMEASQSGDMYIDGEVTSDWMREYLAYFVYFTTRSPLHILMENTSNLAQRFVGTQWSLLIPDKDSYEELLAHIKAYSEVTANALAVEANRLLAIVAGEKPKPQGY